MLYKVEINISELQYVITWTITSNDRDYVNALRLPVFTTKYITFTV